MTISVVLCTYNGEKYIEEQLKSILNQVRPVDEIILLDDGSTDHTVKIAEEILYSCGISFQVIQNEKNLGAAGNFEKGIRLAKGDWIFTSDQDDVWYKQKTQDFEMLFEQRPDCVLAFSDACVTDENLGIIQKSMWEASDFTEDKQQKIEQGKYYDVLCSDNIVMGAAMAVKREFAISCPPSPEGTLHDYWLALCAPVYGSIAMIKKPELFYRQHGANVMGAPVKGIKGKIKRWIHTVKILSDDRRRRAVRANALRLFYSGQKEECLTKMFCRQINEWNEFSADRERLKDSKKLAGLIQIFTYVRQGKYRKYADKKGIVIQDILSLWVKSKESDR